jgi:hypothetical protein
MVACVALVQSVPIPSEHQEQVTRVVDDLSNLALCLVSPKVLLARPAV